MAATLKIYVISNASYSSGTQVDYLVVCNTTGSTQATNATLRLTSGGVAGSGDWQLNGSYYGTYQATITGIRVSPNTSNPIALPFQMLHTAASGTVTLTAELDLGSYGTVTASKSVVIGASTDGTTTISQPMSVTVGSPFDLRIGGNSNRTYDIRVIVGDSEHDMQSTNRAWYFTQDYFTLAVDQTVGTSSHTISLSSISSFMQDSTAWSTRFVALAWSGGEIVGASLSHQDQTLRIPESVVPTISSVTPNDLSGHLSTYGVYVQRFSDIQVGVVCSGVYGSTITSIRHTLDGLSSSGTGTSQHLGTPTTAGQRTIVTVVTDSRGRTATASTPITVGAYTAPSVGSFAAQRWADGAEDDSSDTVRLTTSGALCTINGHDVTGTATFRGRKNEVGTDFAVIDSNSLTGAFSLYRDVTGQDVESSYVYELTVTDSFGSTATVTAQVGTSRPIMDFHVGGEAMGMWTTAREAKYQDGTDATGLFIDNDIIFSEGRGVSGAGGSETGQMVYARLMQASYNYSTDSFILEMLQHFVLANGKHVAGRNASGGITRLLGINESGQAELNWTSGGMRGRVWKTLWSGNLNPGGSVTLSELPYYNVFALRCSNHVGIAVRSASTNYLQVIIGALEGTTTNAINQIMLSPRINGTTLSYPYGALVDPVTNAYIFSQTIHEIIGII